MLNQFIIPTWLVVGVPLLILIGIGVYVAIVTQRVYPSEERDDADDGACKDEQAQNWREN